jgi:hypothetical protein
MSSNVTTDPASVVDSPVEQTPEAADGGSATTTSPFELLPAGESFGVCDLDGVCS